MMMMMMMMTMTLTLPLPTISIEFSGARRSSDSRTSYTDRRSIQPNDGQWMDNTMTMMMVKVENRQ